VTRRLLRAGLLAAAILVAGCGAGAPDPRPQLASLLASLAAGDVAAVCGQLTPAAVTQLAGDFGGTTCTQTVNTASRYVAGRAGERAAVAAADVLPATDLPLSPAPYHAGDGAARVRVGFDDPVLAQRQYFDVILRRANGHWKVSSGLNALFTLLSGS
jgi:hypothetical protein